MYYEINVTKLAADGKRSCHYFATADRSLTDELQARDAFSDFLKRFPKSEGFNVTVSLRFNSGSDVTAEFLGEKVL